MKNNEEMVNSLLERKAKYEIKQRQKKKILSRAATSFGCFCLVAILGFTAFQSGIFGTENPAKTTNGTAFSSVKNTAESVASKNKIIFNKVDGFSGDSNRKFGFDLNQKDYVVMNVSEYYGTNIYPEVPSDLKAWQKEENQVGIYKENGGKGKVYYDVNILNYSNNDFSRSLNIEISKDSMPVTDCAFFDEVKEKSLINGTEVAIGKTDNGYYYAQFMFKNVGFRIIGEGLTENEFVNVLSSLIR